MLILLSPAKTLDYASPLPPALLPLLEGARPGAFSPAYGAEAAELVGVLRGKSAREIATLMELSDDLAELNVARFHAWSSRATVHNSRPALLAFDGDVYGGLQARTLSSGDFAWAQQHLRILSGLYGVLRPLDRLQPYRLEMGRPLETARGANLYDFWGATVARHLDRLVVRERLAAIVNLASQEYFRVTQARVGARRVLKARVVECVFEDWKSGEWKVISFHAKRARGLMARFAIVNRIGDPAALAGFTEEGYAFAAADSEPDRMVFRRRA